MFVLQHMFEVYSCPLNTIIFKIRRQVQCNLIGGLMLLHNYDLLLYYNINRIGRFISVLLGQKLECQQLKYDVIQEYGTKELQELLLEAHLEIKRWF